MNKPNTDAMVAAKRYQAVATRRKVEDTITRMLNEGKSINFNSVSKEADVSKTYLYKHEQLSAHIQTLRAHEQKQSKPKTQNTRSDASKDVLLASKDKRIQELEKQLEKLKKELNAAQAKIFEEI